MTVWRSPKRFPRSVAVTRTHHCCTVSSASGSAAQALLGTEVPFSTFLYCSFTPSGLFSHVPIPERCSPRLSPRLPFYQVFTEAESLDSDRLQHPCSPRGAPVSHGACKGGSCCFRMHQHPCARKGALRKISEEQGNRACTGARAQISEVPVSWAV